MNWRYRKIAILLGDVVLIFAALLAAIALRRPGQLTPGYLSENAAYFAQITPVWIVVFYTLGLYEIRRMSDIANLLQDSITAALVNLMLFTGFFYVFYHQLQNMPKTILILTVLLAHLGCFLWRRLWLKVFLRSVLMQRVAFWGRNKLITFMRRELAANPQLGFQVAELPDFAAEAGPHSHGVWQPQANAGTKLGADMLIVDAEQLEAEPAAGRALVSTAVTSGIPILTDLDFYEELYGQIPPEYAAKPVWLFSHALRKKDRFYMIIKRGLDFCCSAAAVLALSPLLAAIALASFLYDRHNPFYLQRRTGYLGVPFTIWKFRTMVPSADTLGPLYSACGKDKRITPIGLCLRRFRLDELPQLFNVIKGDMSLVGPRPEWTDEVKILEQKVPHYHLRHLVRPGITGWAQVNFKATNNPAGSLEKLHYDLFYIKNMSLGLDIRILLKTARRVFQKEETFRPQN